MIKFICIKCGKVWYTSNTCSNQKCDDCGGLLEDSEVLEKHKKQLKI